MTKLVCAAFQLPARRRLSLLAQTLAALLFGLIIILVVGFAPMDIAHNAAHDSRHGLAFPCH